MRGFILFLAISLVGCGGGDDNKAPIPDANPGGSYGGNITADQSGTSINLGGVVTEDGEAIFISEAGIYTAQLSPDGTSISATFEAYAHPGTTWDGTNSYLVGTLVGTVNERSGISGAYTLGSETGTISLAYDSASYEVPSSVSKVEGMWGRSSTSTGYAVTVSIDSNGNFVGNDTDGCTIQGTISAPFPSYNAYRMRNVYVNCPSFVAEVGPGSGIGQIDSQVSNPGALVFVWKFAQNGVKFSLVDLWYRQ